MIDYQVLQVVWWVLMGFILILYATTAGFDMGITMIMPFFRKETHRRIALNVSAPTWDGNQTWIVFAGGGLFVVWPVVYTTAFSGMYAAILLILMPFFFRPPGYDYRSKIDSHCWRRSWDLGLFISSFCPVFIFGLIFGNCLLGFPFHFNAFSMEEIYTGDFGGLLSIFGIICGLTSVSMIIMHGAAWLWRRTEGDLKATARSIHHFFIWTSIILFSIGGYWVMSHISGYVLVSQPLNPDEFPLHNVVSSYLGAWTKNFHAHPWKYYPAIITYVAFLFSFLMNRLRKYNAAYWASAFVVGGIVATVGATLFPFIMPSSTNPNQSLTIWNSTSSQYALNIMLYVGVILLFIIAAYKAFAYRSVWGKKHTVSEQDLRENDHTFY